MCCYLHYESIHTCLESKLMCIQTCVPQIQNLMLSQSIEKARSPRYEIAQCLIRYKTFMMSKGIKVCIKTLRLT